MSPSEFQRVKCPSREHKPQFGLLSEKTLLLRRTGAWELRGAWEEPSWLSCKVGRGGARFVGGGSWIAEARRWRVASLREGPLRLDLHLEVRLHNSSLHGVARRRARSS
ncbi:hypothetical protein Taro_017794 [Colocasia esculenta]|uniref:Uncharacterized protein n=1 Tax=Colocasia esculenta TaxID=4460 RepID=A0A843UP51_COLES|nr:hypothetical protein [Colocasia esculenta]